MPAKKGKGKKKGGGKKKKGYTIALSRYLLAREVGSQEEGKDTEVGKGNPVQRGADKR